MSSIEKEIIDFIVAYQKQYGKAPTKRLMAEYLRMDNKSFERWYKALIAWGYIARSRNKFLILRQPDIVIHERSGA